MQTEILVSQDKPHNGNGHIGKTDVLHFPTEELYERTGRSKQKLIEGSLDDVFLQIPKMPEKQTIEAVPQQPQAIEKKEFPDYPAIQVHKAIDDDANQSQIDSIQGDHIKDAHNEISSILQARLHGEAYQSEIKAKCFHP